MDRKLIEKQLRELENLRNIEWQIIAGYAPTIGFRIMMAPLPLEELNEIDKLTGKKKIKGMTILTNEDFTELIKQVQELIK